MLNLYLVKVYHNHGFDVMAYKEPACIHPIGQWDWTQSKRPDRRNKTVMYNCFRYRAVWMESAILSNVEAMLTAVGAMPDKPANPYLELMAEMAGADK